MLSTVSPQRAVVPLHSRQLATQPVIETAVPVQLRQLLKQCYGLEEGADLYVLPNNPNKLFVLYRGQLRTVDLSAWQTVQKDNIPAQINSDDLRINSESPVDDTKGDEQRAANITSVASFRTSSTIGRCLHEPEWQKAVSDKERELLQRERRRTSAYKTSLCNAFRDTGHCSYGSECRFAHGVSELRPAPGPHPKYKTQLCNKFALYGSCPYGARCQFIHMRPCGMQNDRVGRMNFTASLDGSGRHAFCCQHYSRGGRIRLVKHLLTGRDFIKFYGRNTYVVEGSTPDRSDAFQQHFFASSNNLQKTPAIEMSCSRCVSESFWHQNPSNTSSVGDVERTSSVLPVARSDGLSPVSPALDNLFSTLNIGESVNPFTQSCFPRINIENFTGKGAVSNLSHVNSTDATYRTS
uniref:C3H1-type domain-containing protein n=1 Tax=Setaria digitata TaxID=48799 RepID=A0A915PYS6_9BILA